MMKTNRMNKELKAFAENPPFGISCWRSENSTAELEAQILGQEGTPYEKGVFKLEIDVPDRYPLVPPKVRFTTPIYHPNIDNAGRICLDVLKMPPQGAWQPMLRLSTVLQSVQLLMAEPNPEDPLMTEIASEYKYNKPAYNKHAEEFTRKYAMTSPVVSSPDVENENKRKICDKTDSDIESKKSRTMGDRTNISM